MFEIQTDDVNTDMAANAVHNYSGHYPTEHPLVTTQHSQQGNPVRNETTSVLEFPLPNVFVCIVGLHAKMLPIPRANDEEIRWPKDQGILLKHTFATNCRIMHSSIEC